MKKLSYISIVSNLFDSKTFFSQFLCWLLKKSIQHAAIGVSDGLCLGVYIGDPVLMRLIHKGLEQWIFGIKKVVTCGPFFSKESLCTVMKMGNNPSITIGLSPQKDMWV